MAVRTAYDPTAGEILTATNLEKFAGGWIGYAEVTSTQTGILAKVDLTSLTVSVTVGPARRIMILGYAPATQVTSAGLSEVDIQEGATVLARGYSFQAAAENTVLQPTIVLTPTTGAHTYKLTGTTTAGTMTLNAETVNPASITVIDVGPAA